MELWRLSQRHDSVRWHYLLSGLEQLPSLQVQTGALLSQFAVEAAVEAQFPWALEVEVLVFVVADQYPYCASSVVEDVLANPIG